MLGAGGGSEEVEGAAGVGMGLVGTELQLALDGADRPGPGLELALAAPEEARHEGGVEELRVGLRGAEGMGGGRGSHGGCCRGWSVVSVGSAGVRQAILTHQLLGARKLAKWGLDSSLPHLSRIRRSSLDRRTWSCGGPGKRFSRPLPPAVQHITNLQ